MFFKKEDPVGIVTQAFNPSKVYAGRCLSFRPARAIEKNKQETKKKERRRWRRRGDPKVSFCLFDIPQKRRLATAKCLISRQRIQNLGA